MVPLVSVSYFFSKMGFWQKCELALAQFFDKFGFSFHQLTSISIENQSGGDDGNKIFSIPDWNKKNLKFLFPLE